MSDPDLDAIWVVGGVVLTLVVVAAWTVRWALQNPGDAAIVVGGMAALIGLPLAVGYATLAALEVVL